MNLSKNTSYMVIYSLKIMEVEMKLNFKNSDSLSIEAYYEEFVEENSSQFNSFFKGSECEVYPLLNENKLYVGLGKKSAFTMESMRKAGFSIGSFCYDKNIEELLLSGESFSEIEDEENLLSLIEGFYLSTYKFDYYKTKKKELKLDNLFFNLSKAVSDEFMAKVEELKSVLDSSFFTRDLVNLRANDIYPETLAKLAKEELSQYGVTVKVYGKEEIEEKGLTAFLAVAKGSAKEPKLIVMEYLNGDAKKPLAFVGKGLTYDSGGYSIKPTVGMDTMHTDMAGAGTVIGAMSSIAKNNLKVNVVAVIAACENMISGNSYHPGDVIKAMSGKTIEVDNTDAEGRVTLADAVYYTVTKYEPEFVIDLATLTGACLITFGNEYTALVSNNDELVEKLKIAAKKSNEKVWELPNDPAFKKLTESKVADIMNAGSRFAGTITGGQFIEEFVEGYPWVHMDIAGTSYLAKADSCSIEGATGVHVKTLYHLAKNHQE